MRFGERVLKGLLHHIIMGDRDYYTMLNDMHERELGYQITELPNVPSPFRSDLLRTGWTIFDT